MKYQRIEPKHWFTDRPAAERQKSSTIPGVDPGVEMKKTEISQ
jgi:hypothetical protein